MGYLAGGPWGSEGVKKKMEAMSKADVDRFTTSYSRTFNAAPTPNNSMMGPSVSSFLSMESSKSFNTSMRSPMGKSPSTGTLALAGRTMSNSSFQAPASPAKSPKKGLEKMPALQLKTFESRDTRRKCLEALANESLETIAKQLFKEHDADGSGQLELAECEAVLMQMHQQFDLPKPNTLIVANLLKKYDTDKSNTLGQKELFDLLKAELKRSAFDRGTVLSREFFLTKSEADVWSSYTREKELGVGSFGAAYKAKHKKSGAEYVVKAVKKTRTSLPLDEIEQEILIMRQIDHPHIVRLFEWYEDSSKIYLVLELLRGGTLKDVILVLQQKEQRGLKEAWIRTVMQQSASAMSYCHNLRLIHKDLKDENIMLLKQDTNWDKPHAVIIDLGIAEMFSVADPSGRMLGGTPTTMAPEVWMGTFGPKCDVWSLGCVFYQMVAGSYPFMARSLTPSAWTRLHKRGPKWDEVKTSGESRELVKSMLSYDEIERPTMSEILQHPWFTKAVHELQTVPPGKFQPFFQACKLQRSRQALLLEIASRLPFSKSQKIIDMFSEIDVDSTGSIDLKELMSYMAVMGIHDQDLVREVFNSLDVDKDGSLSFSEFSSGALLLFKDVLEDQLAELFNSHDANGDGILDANEAEGFLEAVQVVTDLKGITSEAEMFLRSGRITFEQLREYLLGPTIQSRASTARSARS
mmetsp:Transcript_58276/g.103486  ORF Transcript_58276/g.103486 Transcript_58276/m.103486 type:complete len:693 (-) Transcript_58276:160-2238(-)